MENKDIFLSLFIDNICDLMHQKASLKDDIFRGLLSQGSVNRWMGLGLKFKSLVGAVLQHGCPSYCGTGFRVSPDSDFFNCCSISKIVTFGIDLEHLHIFYVNCKHWIHLTCVVANKISSCYVQTDFSPKKWCRSCCFDRLDVLDENSSIHF